MGILDAPLRNAASSVMRRLGTQITMTRMTSGTYNTTSGGGTPTSSNTAVQGTYFEFTGKQLGDHIKLGDRGLTIAAKDLDWTPTTEDRVTDGSVTYRVVRVESPQATDQAAVHMLQLRGGP